MTFISVSGQMMVISSEHLIFMCSAKLDSLLEMQEKKVFISDLAVYDMTREFILLNQLRQAEIDIRYLVQKSMMISDSLYFNLKV